MTSMPEVIKAPPRPAASSPPSPARSGGDEAPDKDFADLLDETAGEQAVDDPPSRADGSRARPKAPRPDSTAKAAVTDTAEPVMPWLTAPLQPAPPAGGELALAPGMAPGAAPGAMGAAATVTAPDGATASLPGAAPDASATPPANLADALVPGAADKAGTGQAPAGAAAPNPPPAGLPATPAPPPQAAAAPVAADAAAPAAQPVAAAATASTAIPAAAAAAAAQTGPTTAPQTAETPEPVTEGGTDPRRAGRTGGRAAGRAAPEAGKPDPSAVAQQQTAAAGQAARGGQPQANGSPAPDLPVSASSSFSSGNAAASGFEALPALHGQAATQYAAAASGRVATAHTPVMTQLAAPLVRVAEAGGGEFHIDLAPAELGRVRVVAEVGDGQVTLSVQAENADTLALLRRDLQQLEKALGDSGLKLDSANLQFSLQGDGQSRGFAAFGQGSGGGGSQGPWRGAAPAEAVAADAPAERAPRPIDGLVDVTI